MSTTSNNTGKKSTPYLPQTSAEKEEAFRLLDEFERELAKEEALRQVLSEKLPRRKRSRSELKPENPESGSSEPQAAVLSEVLRRKEKPTP